MTYTTVSKCGNDHSTWLKELDFYNEELSLLEKRLLEIADKNNGKEVMAEVEHFQNQFIVQRNNMDVLQHNINEHNNKVAEDAKAHAGKMEVNKEHDHKELKTQIEMFEKVFNELRHEYNRFLSKWL